MPLGQKVIEEDGRGVCVTTIGLRVRGGETECAKVEADETDKEDDTVNVAATLLGVAVCDTVGVMDNIGELLGNPGDEVAETKLLPVSNPDASEEGDTKLLSTPVGVPALTGDPVKPLLLD